MTHREFAVEVLEATKGVSGSALRVHLAILAGLDIGEHSRAENLSRALDMTVRSVYRALAELREIAPPATTLPAIKMPPPRRKAIVATAEELAAVAEIIDEFNATFGTAIKSVTAHAPYILRRLRNPEFADLSIDDHRQIIRHAKKNQWFSSPTPNVIYGKDSLLDTARSRWLTGETSSKPVNGRVARQQELLSEIGP